MNRTELATRLAKKTGISQKQANEILEIVFSAEPRKGIIAVALDAGQKVTIPGFGTFSTRRRGARVGRNPRTGEAITIPAKKYAVFKPGKQLKECLDAGSDWEIDPP
ncbi:MAG: HU family DNA-binding protein [bacterium]|nr:HU family DNA-binding protein [bacterium]